MFALKTVAVSGRSDFVWVLEACRSRRETKRLIVLRDQWNTYIYGFGGALIESNGKVAASSLI
jgi:hypothetical protein